MNNRDDRQVKDLRYSRLENLRYVPRLLNRRRTDFAPQ